MILVKLQCGLGVQFILASSSTSVRAILASQMVGCIAVL